MYFFKIVISIAFLMTVLHKGITEDPPECTFPEKKFSGIMLNTYISGVAPRAHENDDENLAWNRYLSKITKKIKKMDAEHQYDVCLRAIQICTINEDDPTNIQIIAEVINKLEDQQIDLRLEKHIYDIDEQYINTKMIKKFLKSIPVIHCKLQKTVTVISQNNDNFSDEFTNINFNNEVSFSHDASDFFDWDTIDKDSYDHDSSGSVHSTNDSPSSDNRFNSGNAAAYTPYNNPGNSNAGPSVITTYTNVETEFLVFLLSEEKNIIYPMYIFYRDLNYYYPVYQIHYKSFRE